MCPNETAEASGFEVGLTARKGWKCRYRHDANAPMCDGLGHFKTHHEQTEGAHASYGQPGKGWGKGGKGKPGGKGAPKGGADRRLDFSDNHEAQITAGQNAAARLLERICFYDDGDEMIAKASRLGRRPTRELDFGRGPSGEKDGEVSMDGSLVRRLVERLRRSITWMSVLPPRSTEKATLPPSWEKRGANTMPLKLPRASRRPVSRLNR